MNIHENEKCFTLNIHENKKCFTLNIHENKKCLFLIPHENEKSCMTYSVKYDDTENRTYLRFTGYPPLITQLNHVGSEGYINAVGHKCVFRVSARESQISIAKLQDYDAHTTRCVQE